MILLQSAPSWDLVVTLAFVIGVTYGFIMLRDRVLVTLLSLYAGTLVANHLYEPVQRFFSGDVAILNKLWVESSVSPFAIKLTLFGLIILVVGAKSGLAGRRSSFSFFELIAYSFFNVAIGLSSVFSFMGADQLKTYVESSKLIALIVSNQTLWYVAPLVILAIMGVSPRARYTEDY